MTATHTNPGDGTAVADPEHLGKIHDALQRTLDQARILFAGAADWHADTVIVPAIEPVKIRPAQDAQRKVRVRNVGTTPIYLGNSRAISGQPNGGACLLPPPASAGQTGTEREIASTAEVWAISIGGQGLLDYQAEVIGG